MKQSEFFKKGLHIHVRNLFPICRSITGDGIRKTLKYFENFHSEYKRMKFCVVTYHMPCIFGDNNNNNGVPNPVVIMGQNPSVWLGPNYDEEA